MRVVLVGGGGHASDVLAAFEAKAGSSAASPVVGIVDDREVDVRRFDGRGVALLGPLSAITQSGATHYVLAAGWPRARQELFEQVARSGLAPVSITDPGARVHPSVAVGAGTVVLWGAHVSAKASVGDHVLLSHGALIGHDCRIGDFASVMPGAAVSGDVALGRGCTVGSNATVREGLTIGEGSTLAAGAVAVRDIPPGVTAKGVPARW